MDIRFDTTRSNSLVSATQLKRRSDSRLDTEREVNDKHSEMKQIYEMRIRSFSENFKQLFNLVGNDQMLSTMKRDNSSMEFANQRVKEIIEDFLHSEREYTIEKLASQYSLLKNEYQKLIAEISKVIKFLVDA